MDRRELIESLKKFKERVGKRFDVEMLILFGSQSRGKIKKESDVDLIVVGNFKERSNLKRSPKLYLEWKIDLPVDFLCYTPKEFEKLRRRVSVVRKALSEGVVIE